MKSTTGSKPGGIGMGKSKDGGQVASKGKTKSANRLRASEKSDTRSAAKARDGHGGGSERLATVSGAPVVRTLEQSIGNKVRDYRKTANLTVTELAHEAGISAGMLSKIENGQISASLGTLQDLSSALNLQITDLLSGHTAGRGCSFVKAGSGTAIRRRGTKVGHNYNLLGQWVGGEFAFEPYLITLAEDAESYTEFRHEGVEFIYMLTGELIYVHGDQSYHLTPGDSLLFDSAELHGPAEMLTRPISYLSIIVYRR